MRITVLGGGSWGTALANLMAANGHEAVMLVRDAAAAANINERHENSRYLPGLPLHPALRACTDPEEALSEARICILAVPCQSMRQALTGWAGRFPPGTALVCVSKGIEISNLAAMHQVVADTLPGHADRYAILSGPSFAKEVAQGKPTTVALGCADPDLGNQLRDTLSSPLFRVYSTTDVIGVELGGAMKNVMAIAAGMSDGLNLGHNARAGLITRGLAEMSRLGKAMGANEYTFMGLSGMGDLVLTCTGDLSRNRQVGMRLGSGESMEQIRSSMDQVAEGVKTTEAVCELAKRHGVELPLSESVRVAVSGPCKPSELVHTLMTRALRDE